jgi:hypothetical protein
MYQVITWMDLTIIFVNLMNFYVFQIDPEDFRDAALAYPDGLIQYDHFTHRSSERVSSILRVSKNVHKTLHFMMISGV